MCVLLSGTIFYSTERLPLQVAKISWEKEANFRLPVETWRSLMDRYYPQRIWLPVPRDLVEQLAEYQRANQCPNWEFALEKLLAAQSRQTALGASTK